MTKFQLTCFMAIVLALVAAKPKSSLGRGLGGGMRGGMGGMRAGGLGAMRGGMGGMRAGGLGGMRGGMGGMRAGGLGAMRGGMGGMERGLSGMRGGGVGGPKLYGAQANRFPGGARGGFGGADRGALGGRDAGVGRAGGRPDRNQMGKFLGLPSDGGLHAAAGGNRLGRDARGLERYPNAALRNRGDYVRRGFVGRDFYTRDWYRRYPGAWNPRAWGRGGLWGLATWRYMNDWLDYGGMDPMYYDYGNTVVYQDNSVYMNGQDMGTADAYYQQAQSLAETGGQAQTSDDDQWMSLGVFAMTSKDHTKSDLILQLAVNKDGVIRGNYTATVSDHNLPVQGSVDKKTQRAAWTIGDKKQNVIETGIYNLTKDEAPALVHFGKDKTEQWVLVRLKQDEPTSDTKSNIYETKQN